MPYIPYDNPTWAIYDTNRAYYDGNRRYYVLGERDRVVSSREEARAIQRFWRDNGNAGTTECVVAWINATFGAQLTELPPGEAESPSHCPIANALWSLGKFDEVEVNGPTVEVARAELPNTEWDADHQEWIDVDTGEAVRYREEIETPICVRVFVNKFDQGDLPQYNLDGRYDLNY